MTHTMATDQYGNTYRDLGPHPRKALLARFGRSHTERMYRDTKQGTVHAAMCDLFHGTTKSRLPLIAREGLLPCDQLQAKGRTVVFPDYSRPGVVYAVDSEDNATRWASRAAGWRAETYELATLCIDAEPARFDRNLHDDGGSQTCFFGSYAATAYEIDGPVPPDRIRVHDAGRCIPLSEYVKEAHL